VPTLGQARFRLLLARLCLAPTSCDFGEDEAKDSSPAQSEGAPEHAEIQSSLDGFSILPRRIAWTATTSLPLGEVREVRFASMARGCGRIRLLPLPTVKKALNWGPGWAPVGTASPCA
jgi:hypothetical protein